MKRIFLLLLVCFLVYSNAEAKRYIVTQDVKVRAGKGAKFDTLGTIQKGTIINLKDTVSAWREVPNGDGDEVGYINAKFLDDAPHDDFIPEEGSLNYTVQDWMKHHLIITLLGFVALLLVVRSVALSIYARKHESVAVQYEEKYKTLVKYWFHCKHCSALIKNDREPSSNGCAKSHTHLWFQLAEVGQHKYHCKNCNVTINAKMAPTDHGCPGAALHRWELKGK